MVCDGISGGIGWTPNLNKNQKGVPGLQDIISKTNGKTAYAGTVGNESLYQYYSKNGKDLMGMSLFVKRDDVSGSVEYSYAIKIDGQRTMVKAYDTDGDGNIDRYTLKDNINPDRTFKNEKDDGKANFVQESKGSKLNPLNWFK